MQILCSAQKQHGILEQENRTEQGTGQGGATGTGPNGMALHYDMGMLAETQRKGQNAGITRLHPEPHLPKGQKHKTLHTRGRRNTNGGRARKGRKIENYSKATYKQPIILPFQILQHFHQSPKLRISIISTIR